MVNICQRKYCFVEPMTKFMLNIVFFLYNTYFREEQIYCYRNITFLLLTLYYLGFNRFKFYKNIIYHIHRELCNGKWHCTRVIPGILSFRNKIFKVIFPTTMKYIKYSLLQLIFNNILMQDIVTLHL